MDYDDNDFQSQNLHIAGEGGNKFPPVLPSYALPKFEFDDSLHGHLRFDSLVETEVFLGIESNEDNQWIEDFSRGSTGIQFSSTAAEPCSIPRRNNVWSEATSSESVEMLLKSVGQEEIIPVQTSIRESDACDELGCIMKQMEPNSKQENTTATNAGDVQPTLSTCDILDESPLLDGNDGVQQPVISSTHEVDAPVDGGVDDATATAEVELPLTAGGTSVDDKTNNNNQSEADDRTQRESASGIEHDCAADTVQNISSNDNELSSENARNLITETANAANDGKNVSETENSKNQEKVSLLDQEMKMNDQALPENVDSSGSELENPVCSATVEPVEDRIVVAANVDMDEHSCAMPKANSGSSKHTVIGDQLEGKNNEMSIMELERNATSNSEEIKESEVSELDKNLGDHAHLLSTEHHKDSVHGVVECNSRCVDNSRNVGVANSSDEQHSEEHGKNLVSYSMSVGSAQASEKDMLMEQDDVSKNDESGSVVKKDAVFTSAGSHPDAPDNKLESAAGNESQSAIDSASVDEVSVSSGIGIATVLIGSREEEKSPLPVLVLNHSEKEVIAVEKSSDVKTGEDAVFGTVGHMLLESASKSQAMVDSCNVERQSDSQAIVSTKASQEFAKNTELHAVHYDSAENKEDGATVTEKENDKKAISTVLEPDNSKKDQDKEAIMNSSNAGHEKLRALGINEHEREPDQNKVTGGSQTVICNRLSENESEKDGMRRLTDQTVSVAEVTFVDANKVLTISQDPKQTDASKDERGLSVEVGPLVNQPKKEAATKSHTGSRKRGSKASVVVDGSLSTPGSGQSNSKVVQDVVHGNPKVSDVTTVRSGSKGTSERRPRRASCKSTGKEITKKGTPAKETASVRLGDKIGNVSLSPSGISQLVQSNEIPHYVHTDSGSLKPFVLATSTSGLPDLNSASSVVFQQPFTDLQQVQLRAQIFVYGALIQGTAPDEPYMISAFGGPDGGRTIWESAWRSCMERLLSQKSHLITPETPLQSRSGVKVTPARSSKGTSTTIVSPMLPVSSPLWNLPTPTGDALQSSGLPRGPVLDYQRALSPLHPHQTPPARTFVGHNPSWISQAPFGPWVGTPQTSAIDASGRFSVHLPATEAVQLTPVKETVPHPSTAKHVPPGPVVQSEASAGGFTGISPVIDVKKIAASSGQSSVDPKPRKRKKTSVPENKGHNVLLSQPQTVSVPSPVTGSQPSAAAAIAVPVGFGSSTLGEKLITSASSARPIDMAKGSQNAEQRPILSEETLGKVKVARMQAEDAAALAAAAVNHSQEIWNQLEKQRSSGLLFDVETKLASAAVAIAAAAAVAKAAAAVANVASNAALQAKLMADEAIASGSSIHPNQSNVISISDGMKNLGKATPASILKGDDGTNASSSILVAAREAAKKRVEAASAASKRAENMDAIVKAAELAAEAVSQAGKIVAMGDPLPLGELIAAGPEVYWKSQLKEVGKDNLNVDNAGALDTFASHSKMDLLEKRDTLISNRGIPTPNENVVEDYVRLIDSLPPSSVSTKDPKGQKGNKVADLAKTIGVVPESDSGQKLSFAAHGEPEITPEASKDGSIQEGSHVEVFKDGNGFKAAWFSASVLSLKDGKAYVSYNDLTSGGGLEKLKEWVALKSEGNRAPEIRLARPVTAVPFEGTRKRRRANLGEYNWSVGDRVEAWIQDSWWEGVITDKNKKDETLLTVNFPVQGDTSVVRAWHLRPLLVWKDGEWVEWSSSRENDHSVHSGDTPQEKRPRRQSPTVEVKGKDKMSTSIGAVGSDKPREPTLLELTADEKIFNIGKSNRDGNKHDTLRITRTGLQKEGSKVIFGVPKPGKKRKFMEVSKHYVADRSGKREASESVKFTKYLMPQGTGSRGWKNPSKNEPIGKRPLVSKPRGVKSGKVQNVSGRSVAQKDNSSSAVSASDDRAGTENFVKNKDSASHGDDASGKQNTGGFQSVSSSEGAGDSMVFSSVDVTTDTLTSKKTSSSNTKPERVSKGKLAPAGRKLGKVEEEKSTMDPIEPRRSNRRIQPTSRLLEGLQSSLMVSKIPSVSHDKSHKNRNASRGNN